MQRAGISAVAVVPRQREAGVGVALLGQRPVARRGARWPAVERIAVFVGGQLEPLVPQRGRSAGNPVCHGANDGTEVAHRIAVGRDLG